MQRFSRVKSDSTLILYAQQDSTRAFEHPGFIMRLVLEGDTVKFEPEFKDFEVFLNLVAHSSMC